MSRRFLYRRFVYAVIVILMVCTAVPRSAGQGLPELKRPQEDNSEQKPVESKKKKVKGPRAVGLVQLSNGKATLIPVAVLVDGRFYDASVYKAEPVPMALERGTVYEAEQAGESQGLFTTNGALHSKSASSTDPWMATGSYLPNGSEAAKTTHRAEDVPVGLDSSGDEPPRLTRKSAATNSTPASSPSGSVGGTKAGEKGAGSAPSPNGTSAGSNGDAAKGTTAPSAKTADQKDQKPPSQPQQTPSSEPPSEQTSQPAGPTAQGQGAAQQKSQGQDAGSYYRPTLRRGKPTQAAPEEEEPAAKVVTAGSTTSPANLTNVKPAQVMPAISDAGGPEPQSYKFFWKEGEEEERRKQMLALAADELRAYINAREKGAIGVKAGAASGKAGSASRKATVKPAQPVFENIQFRAFDVWKNSQPVMILTAEAHYPAEPNAASAPVTYSITLASRTDIYGSLRKLYSGVTDKFHLDVTPRLELIDAVDADGDGRGELLFRETTDGGKGYVIYRPTGDKLWKMFDSLGT